VSTFEIIVDHSYHSGKLSHFCKQFILISKVSLFAQNPLIDRLASLFKLLYAIQFLVLIYTFTYVEDLTSHSRTKEIKKAIIRKKNDIDKE
jgi:hypothetical protein